MITRPIYPTQAILLFVGFAKDVYYAECKTVAFHQKMQPGAFCKQYSEYGYLKYVACYEAAKQIRLQRLLHKNGE